MAVTGGPVSARIFPDPAFAAADVEWRPTPEYVARSRLKRFMERHGLGTVEALWQRSVDDAEWFWDAVVRDDLQLEWTRPYERVLDPSAGLPWTRWFVGGRLSYVDNAVDRWVRRGLGDRAALVWEGEDGRTGAYTYAELRQAVDRTANALRALGVERGDRVGIYLPMIPECAVATLACGKLGAIFTPIFSGFGATAVATRLRDCEAKVLVTADGFHRRGKLVAMKEVADEAAAESPSIERLLVVRYAGRERVPWREGRDVWWHEIVAHQDSVCPAVETDAEDPYMVIYTSGTTGRPKGAVHVHAGFPIKAAQDLAHCFDLQPGAVMFWFTDMGWMMGPWLVSGALLLGATAFLYDGAPDFPGPERIWHLVSRHRITHLGLSPTGVRGLMRYGEEPVRRHDLRSLRVLGSTGEPWNPEPWRWYFEHAGGGRCPIINYSGGTEVSGGIVGGTTLQPLKPCAFTGPVPGMPADVLDEAGRPVRGTVGELVLRGPWPGMTRGFWQDRERYLEAYWSRWPDVWVHGDWALIDEDGFWYILGRSDDTIKVAGKRVGPAEVESAAVSHPAVSEAAAIGAPDELKGEAVVLFAVLRPNYEPSDMLRREVEETVVRQLGRPLRPEAVRFVRDLPKTRNAKILRRVIRAAYLGRDPGDLSSLENPDAVQEIVRSR